MRDDLLVRFKLLGCALCFVGCTSTLDFDAVSRGSSNGDGDGDSSGDPNSFSCDAMSPAPTFCDDFDHGDVDEVWESVVIAPEGMDNVGVLKNDGNASVSGDRSLLAIMNDGIKGDYVAVAATQSFAEFEGKAFRATIDFEMRVEQIDNTPDHFATVFQFLLGADPSYSQLVLSLVSKGEDVSSRFRENISEPCPPAGCTKDHPFKNVPNLSEWAHVSFVLEQDDPGGSDNHVTVKVDDAVLFDGKLAFDLHKENPRIELGVPWIDGKGEDKSWRVRYDNVLVNITEK
jgi:hypothetical protein